ncbi:MAG: SPFH domain-containing protein [Mycolicibacterium sp.]|nr:SPFH domain-containing protein [Mycolicibacterium sp.]
MPGWWIFAIVLFVLAALVATGAVFARGTARFSVLGGAVILVLLGLLCTIISSYDRVDTRNVGIITEFGRPVGVHGAGIVWHAPWKKVSELSEAIQLQAFESNSYDDAAAGRGVDNNPPAINVRLANNSNAYVDINLNWRLREGAAPKLFQDYGGSDVFNTIKVNLVDRQAQVALSKTFATFNPQTMLAAAASTPGDPNSPAPVAMMSPAQGADLPGMAATVKKDLQDAVGGEIEILDVRIPRLFYDPSTQQRIDAYNQKVQDTINAAQDVKTATQNRLAA